MDVCITGMGCISPLGGTVAENRLKLQNEEDGLVRAQYLESQYASKKYFGEVKVATADLYKEMQLKDLSGLTRTDLLAFKAFREAVSDAGLSSEELSSRKTAFISASTVGGMCLTDQLYNDSNLKSEETEFASSYNCSAHTLQIAKYFGMKGYTNTINTACSSSANAIMLGMRLIKSGRAERAIVGGVDSLAKYTVNGFNALQILSDEKCMPFDINRSGLNLGEAAAYLVLESSDLLENKKRYARVVGAGNTNDAFHTSSMSEDAVGVCSCMQIALDEAGLKPEAVDYINAHGTGTGNNDLVETTGFFKMFENVPSFSSTKSYTGHTLGAAGGLEAIFTVFSIYYKELYPSLRVNDPVQNAESTLIKTYQTNAEVSVAMSNSYGFGGNCTSLIFRE